MDRRKCYLIGIDTETLNALIDEKGKMDLSQSLVYDIGWQVCDKHGNVYRQRSFVIRETFYDMSEAMKSAYFANKIPRYNEEIAEGKRIVANLYTVRNTLLADINFFNVKAIFAHNASFDVRALNNTIRYITKSKYRYFLPYGIEIWDTLKMARQTIGKQKTYIRFCEANGYLTMYGKPRFTAEILYRYISNEDNFEENHTGLEDVIIETEILVRCYAQHKKMEKRLWP